MAKVDPSLKEIKAVHDLCRYALLMGSPPNHPIKTFADKLKAVASEHLCRHCGEQFSTRANGLCDTCNAYQNKYGRLTRAS